VTAKSVLVLARDALASDTLGDSLLAVAASAPRASTVFPDADAEISAAGLADLAHSCARSLLADGVAPGDVVGVLAPAGPGLLAALFGSWLAGAAVTVLPLPSVGDPAAQLGRLSRIADSAGMRHLVADARGLDCARLLQRDRPGLRVWPAICPLPPRAVLPGVRPDDLAVVQFTSGTTTRPRGVMLSHRAVLAGLRSMVTSSRITASDVLVQWMPHYHDMGLFGHLATLLTGGDSLVFDPLTLLRRPGELLRRMSASRATLFTGMNFAYEMLIAAATPAVLDQLDLSSWRLAYNGAEPVSAATVARFAQTFSQAGVAPHVMHPVYGLAEATLGVTFPEPGTPARMATFDRAELGATGRVSLVGPDHPHVKTAVSVGRPVSGLEVRLADEQGPVPGSGKLGEIQVRGAAVTSGYLNDAGATAALFDGGWLRTGDLGFRLGDDYYVMGRRKEMIIVHGQNYFPEDAEAIARAVPGVYRQHAVAVAETDSGTDSAASTSTSTGERIAVIAETTLSGAQATDLQRQIRQRVTAGLGTTQISVHLVTPRWLTRTTSGKWQRLLAARKLSEGTRS
jgi:fatty-acyl-CoA synthase